MNEMKQFFILIEEQLTAGHDLAVVTITASSGSVPRGAGAHMLVNETGRIFGTIGGGAVEYRVEQEALTVLKNRSSCFKDYDLSSDSADLGMICGGTVTVYIKYLSSEEDGCEPLLKLCLISLECFEKRHELWLFFDISSNGEGEMGVYSPEYGTFPEYLQDPGEILKALPKHAGTCKNGTGRFYGEQICSGSLVHILGGGHIARELVPLLSKTGFDCAVYDDREEFLQKDQFPEALALIKADFTCLKPSLLSAAKSYFVVMTRGHQYDLSAEAAALQSPSVYIGVIGSRKKIAAVSEKLLSQGFTRQDLARVHTPIGLSIGAETPAEIAVSIAAELIQSRHSLSENQDAPEGGNR